MISMSKQFVDQAMSRWMEGDGPSSQIVISSRVRLARNLQNMPFPHMLNDEGAKKVVNIVQEALKDQGVQTNAGGLAFVNMQELSPFERQILVDKHLISPQHAENASGRGLLLRQDEAVSVLINEEDHLRIQVLFPGLQLKEAWNLASQVDDALETKLDFAFHEARGYLTACPTNVGTGLRASVMMHLPGLVMANQVGRVLTPLSQLGMAVRGLYGEGTEATGNLFQISNQITLGRNELEIIQNLAAVTQQIIDQENMARHLLEKETKYQLEDRVSRAFGILTHARILTSQEAMTLLSEVRLGCDLGLIEGVSLKMLNELLVLSRPAFLQKMAGREMTTFERDIKRADIIREKLLE